MAAVKKIGQGLILFQNLDARCALICINLSHSLPLREFFGDEWLKNFCGSSVVRQMPSQHSIQYVNLGCGPYVCTKEQERLIPLEQATRQNVDELLSTMESEKNHESVLKAILQAKELNYIHGIYVRMADLGAVDAENIPNPAEKLEPVDFPAEVIPAETYGFQQISRSTDNTTSIRSAEVSRHSEPVDDVFDQHIS